ncbi:MAG: M43 family zinc metalloprotease [Chitinophagales bacterium]|nr:M43 family zinc metalloprotease [Chitinophagales bacterium]
MRLSLTSKHLFILLATVLLSTVSYAQQHDGHCATMPMDTLRRSKVVGAPSLDDFEQWLQPRIAQFKQQSLTGRRSVITIPVVVHVIHNGDAVGSNENISQAQVNSQIAVLNRDFRRLNADTVNTPSAFRPVAADVEIEFCLALVDPNGNLMPEPGIDRVNLGVASWPNTSDIDNDVKPATIWDPNQYFNIWTCDFGSTSSLLGYAQFPEGSGLAGMPTGAQDATTDGVVVNYDAFGTTGSVSSPWNGGRTATHEVGHWLGLRHIWGDGGCGVDDYCNDTPESDAANRGCPTTHVSCGTTDMVQNYMDYTNDACMNIFTQDQKDRMLTVMANSPRRVQLLNSTVCQVRNQITLTGQVRDINTLVGIPNAKVRLIGVGSNYNYNATTDAFGNFSITVFEGTYNIYGGQWGYRTQVLANRSLVAPLSPVTIDLPTGYYDDFVLDFGWAESGTAASGEWERGAPIGTLNGSAASNPGADVSIDLGPDAYVTGNAGGTAGNDDVDNGNTILTSPSFNLSAYSNPYLSFYRWFYNAGGSGTPNDTLFIRISNGTTTVLLERLTVANANTNQWVFRDYRIRDFITPSNNMRFILETADLSSSGHLVEAALDMFSIRDSQSVVVNPPVANFGANRTSNCVGAAFSFIDSSSGGITSRVWQFPGGTPATSSATNPQVSYTAPGTYNVILIVSNANGSDTLIRNNYITVNALPAASTTASNALCNNASNGSATVSVNAGSSPFTFLWSNGQTTATANNLAAGTYQVTVTDANGCSITSSASVSQPNAIIVSPSAVATSCGNANGSASATAAGGTPPYSFAWTGGRTGSTISNLPAGLFTVTVTDANGCTVSGSVSVSGSAGISLTPSTTPAFCGRNNGSAAVAVSGGTAPYSYFWSAGSIASSVNNLIAGNFGVTVTDANGCQASALVTVPSSGTNPSINLNVTDASCSGSANGSISASISSGQSPYVYLWSNNASASLVQNLTAGSYSLTVTDANGCSAVQQAIVAEPVPLQISATVGNATCGNADGAASGFVSGGTGPYSYVWNTGSNGNAISGVAAGVYTLTVTDALGCSNAAVINVNDIGAPAVLLNTVSPSCFGLNDGSIDATLTGGVGPFTYQWSNSSSGSSLTGIAAGSYTVTVIDQNNCQSTASTTISQPTQLQINISKMDATCGNSNASITATVNGGTGAYQYLWSNNNTASSLNSLSAGNYLLTVTDAVGCQVSSNVTVSSIPAPQISPLVRQMDCFGNNNAEIALNVVSSVPYNLTWSNGSIGTQLNDLAAGSYAYEFIDSNGCTLADTFTIDQLPQLIISNVATQDIDCNSKLGYITPTLQGGTPTYSYLWSDSTTTPVGAFENGGTYSLTVTDANGCTISASAAIVKEPELQIVHTSQADTSATGTGLISLQVQNGLAPFTYVWSDSSLPSSDLVTGLAAGTYYVTVEDANGCRAYDTILVDMVSGLLNIAGAVPSIQIYPNPNQGIFHVTISNIEPEDYNIEVYNVVGELVFDMEAFDVKDKDVLIDLSRQASANYYVKVSGSNFNLVKKITRLD